MQDRTTHEAFAICRRPSQFGHSDYVYKLDTSRAKKKKSTRIKVKNGKTYYDWLYTMGILCSARPCLHSVKDMKLTLRITKSWRYTQAGHTLFPYNRNSVFSNSQEQSKETLLNSKKIMVGHFLVKLKLCLENSAIEQQ